jgi:hypothetical protein
MNSTAERLKKVREHLKFSTQSGFSLDMGWRKTRVQDVESGKVKGLSSEEAQAIQKKYGINGWWLLTGEGDMLLDGPIANAFHIKNYEDKSEESLPFPARVIGQFTQSKDLLYYRVSTDIMSPTFNISDILIFDTDISKMSDGVFIIEVDGCITCRRLQFLIHKEVRIFQDNKNYEPMTTRLEAIKVIGRVIMRFSQFIQ